MCLHNIKKTAPKGTVFSVSKKCLAEFAAAAANKVKSIFDRGVYLGENTSQAASVRVVRRRRTRSACSRLQKNCRKAPWGIFDSEDCPKGTVLHVCGRLLDAADAVQQLAVLLHGMNQVADQNILLHNNIPPTSHYSNKQWLTGCRRS